MSGGVVPDSGIWRIDVCAAAVICAFAVSTLAPGCKNTFTTPMPVSDWLSTCSTSFVTVVTMRSKLLTMRFSMSSGVRPP